MAELFRYDLIPPDGGVLCALSGGADSMYLLCRLLEKGYRVHAAHYNHCLRPTADRDEEFVRSWCEEHGVPLTVGRGDVSAHAASSGIGIEEAARELRYEFLQRAAKESECTLIATGHHADDNAETVLMNLIRGCGLGGLCGIPEQRGNLVRPMLEISRQDIEAYLTAHGVPHVEDESNEDITYTRNRIRHQLIPLMEELNPHAATHIAAAARRVSEDERELQRQAELLLEVCVKTEEGVTIPVTVLAKAPRPLAVRALKALAPTAQSSHIEGLLELCCGKNCSGELDVPGGVVRRAYDDLLFTSKQELVPQPIPLQEGEQSWSGWKVICTPAVCPPKAYVDKTCFYLRSGRYLIRSRQEGDVLKLGHRPQKTLKKLMIEEQIPRHLRHFVPVLADESNRAAAVGGFGPHWAALAQPETNCLKIMIQKENELCIKT